MNMLRYYFALILSALALSVKSAPIDVIFETQWQQSGYPVNASKWQFSGERKLSYSINAQASNSAANEIRKALAAVSEHAQIEFVPLTNATDTKTTAQLQFEVSRYTEEQLRAAICSARVNNKNFVIERAQFSISEQRAYRCTLHELMHGFGLLGHPSGDTVLSYFEGNRSGLKEMDKFLLKHWNSDLIAPGMNVFRATQLLGEQWIAEKVAPDHQAAARQEQSAWMQKTVAQMDAFADGQGEPPTILFRSGRMSETGLQRSRLAIQGILGVAHLEGYGMPRNPARARDLLLKGNQAKMQGARTALQRGLNANKFEGTPMSEVCHWIKNTPLAESQWNQAQVDEAMKAKACASP